MIQIHPFSSCRSGSTGHPNLKSEREASPNATNGAKGIATRSKDATRGSWHRYKGHRCTAHPNICPLRSRERALTQARPPRARGWWRTSGPTDRHAPARTTNLLAMTSNLRAFLLLVAMPGAPNVASLLLRAMASSLYRMKPAGPSAAPYDQTWAKLALDSRQRYWQHDRPRVNHVRVRSP